MHPLSYYIVSSLTLYRLVMSPVLLVLVFTGQLNLFAILLPVSFFTDLIDGTLARKYHVESRFGARLDSIADDATVLVAIIGLFYFKPEFIAQEKSWLIPVVVLFVIQTAAALVRYGKISSFHTYLAKIAACLQGAFFVLIFLLPQPLYPLFYAASVVTAVELIEEIILVGLLPAWEVNVKGLYWVLKKKRGRSPSS